MVVKTPEEAKKMERLMWLGVLLMGASLFLGLPLRKLSAGDNEAAYILFAAMLITAALGASLLAYGLKLLNYSRKRTYEDEVYEACVEKDMEDFLRDRGFKRK